MGVEMPGFDFDLCFLPALQSASTERQSGQFVSCRTPDVHGRIIHREQHGPRSCDVMPRSPNLADVTGVVVLREAGDQLAIPANRLAIADSRRSNDHDDDEDLAIVQVLSTARFLR